MAESATQIRAQIEAARARLEEDLEQLGPLVSRRLQRARRLAVIGALAAAAVLLLPILRLTLRHRARARAGRRSKQRTARRQR